MSNLFHRFKEIFPDAPLELGQVQYVEDGVATIQLLSGGIVKGRGPATAGGWVYVRDGAIEGDAPALPTSVIFV